MKKKTHSKSTLSLAKSYVLYWAPRLRLRDWSFEIKIHDDVDKFKDFASNTHYTGFQYSKLDILEPSKIPDDWVGVKDLEVTVVHELLHTRLVHLPRPSKNEKHHEEMAVETMALLLVALRRGVEPWDIE